MSPEKKSAEKISQPETQAAVVERAGDKFSQIVEEARRLDVEAQKRIGGAEKESGLPLGEIVAARRETGVFARLEGIFTEARFLADAMERGLSAAASLRGGAAVKQKKYADAAQAMEPFRPDEEVRKILKAPKEEREERLLEFKKKFAAQKWWLAKIQQELIGEIREDPDAPLGDFYEALELWAKAGGGVSEKQKEIARSFLRAYKEKHDRLKSVREQYPDDIELFRVLFGKKPEGKVHIIQGPITLYVRCFNADDYEFVFSGAFRGEAQGKAAAEGREKEIARAKLTGGANIPWSLVPGLEGTITIEKPERADSLINRGTLRHEEQHAIERLFREQTWKGDLWLRVCRAKTPKEAELAVRDFLRVNREALADETAGGEILAYFKDGVTGEEILEIMTKSKEQGGLYDYLNGEKEKLLASSYLFSALEHLDFNPKPILERVASEVYGNEYKNLLKNGIEAVESVAILGYPKERVVALFIHEPLRRWEKVAKRFLEGYLVEKRKRS